MRQFAVQQQKEEKKEDYPSKLTAVYNIRLDSGMFFLLPQFW